MNQPQSVPMWMFLVCLTTLVASAVVVSTPATPSSRITHSMPQRAERLPITELGNLWMLPLSSRRMLYSGGQPEGDAGFQALADLGIRTIISVDGARPDLEHARQHGLRYVHLPISYDDVPERQLMRMVQAVEALPGPVYVHCHHGRHRGPASAVSIWRCLNPNITPEAALETLKAMGTAARYRGLYRAVERDLPSISKPSSSEFPEVTPAAPLAEHMGAIDLTWEQIVKLVQLSDPAAEDQARLDEHWTHLAELFRESARLGKDDGQEQGVSLRQLLAESAAMLIPEEKLESAQATRAWQQSRIPEIESRCASCHAQFRD